MFHFAFCSNFVFRSTVRRFPYYIHEILTLERSRNDFFFYLLLCKIQLHDIQKQSKAMITIVTEYFLFFLFFVIFSNFYFERYAIYIYTLVNMLKTIISRNRIVIETKPYKLTCSCSYAYAKEMINYVIK